MQWEDLGGQKGWGLGQIGGCTERAASGDEFGSWGSWRLGLLEIPQINGKVRPHKVRADGLTEETQCQVSDTCSRASSDPKAWVLQVV